MNQVRVEGLRSARSCCHHCHHYLEERKRLLPREREHL